MDCQMCTGVHIQKRRRSNEEKNHSQEDSGKAPALLLEAIKLAQASQKLEELLTDPKIVQKLRDWRTNIRERERDSDIWGPLNQEEETVLALLEEYLV